MFRQVEFYEPSGKKSRGFFHTWAKFSYPSEVITGRVDMEKYTKAIIERKDDGQIFLINPMDVKFKKKKLKLKVLWNR